MEMAKPIYTWKKNLNPKVVLDKLSKMVNVTEDGKVSFVGWDYHEIIVALENMVEIKNASRDLYLPALISKAVTHSAKEKLDDNNVLLNLNKLAKENLATKIKKYRVLTSVSLPLTYPKRKFKVANSEIHIVSDFPLGESIQRRHGAPYLVIHRVDLMTVLQTACEQEPGITIKYGMEIQDAAPHANGVTLLVRNNDLFDEPINHSI